jgi:RimJ/RimL family protein N-acetyltransferase
VSDFIQTEQKEGFSVIRHAVSRDLFYEPFDASMISGDYLSWLNDPEVNRYSQRRFQASSKNDAVAFLNSLSSTNQILAIRLRADNRHIGNLQLGPVDLRESRGEIRILIGDKGIWGKGYATQAIHLACCYYFDVLNFHRVESMSCNPAFIRTMEKLGWKLEGIMRERFPLDGERLDYRIFGMLRTEFAIHPELLGSA